MVFGRDERCISDDRSLFSQQSLGRTRLVDRDCRVCAGFLEGDSDGVHATREGLSEHKSNICKADYNMFYGGYETMCFICLKPTRALHNWWTKVTLVASCSTWIYRNVTNMRR